MDPVLSSLGFAIGLIAFLSQTVPTIAGQIERAKTELADLHFADLRLSLENSHRRYEDWVETWWESPAYNDEYREIWGPSGFDEIRRSRAVIKSLIDRILTNLCNAFAKEHKHEAADPDGKYFQTRVRMLQDASAGANPGNPGDMETLHMMGVATMLQAKVNSFLKRVWWGMYRHESISVLVEMLDRQTRALTERSGLAFKQVGLHSEPMTVNRRIVRRTKILIHISRLASTLYDMSSERDWPSVWTVHLAHPQGPQAGAAIDFWGLVTEAKLRFSVWPRNSEGTWTILEFKRLGPAVHRRTRLLDYGIDQLMAHPRTLEHDGMLYRVTQLTKVDRPSIGTFRDGAHKSLDRAEAAVVATAWYMLLLRAEWFSHLCGCRIRWTVIEHSNFPGFTPDTISQRLLEFHPLEEHHSEHCNRQETYSEKLELFGLLLGELLTERAMRLGKDSLGCKTYHVAGWPEPFTRAGLVLLVKRLVRHPVTEAFAWCLDQADEPPSRKNLPYANFRDMLDNILPRLIEYHALVYRQQRAVAMLSAAAPQ